MKIKFFVFNPYPAIGGTDYIINKFLKYLNFEKIEVIYFHIKNPYQKLSNVKYVKLSSKSSFTGILEIKKIISKYNDEKKIFFSAQYFVNSLVVFFLKNISKLKIFIYEVNHPIELDHGTTLKDFFKKKLIKFIVKKYYKNADIVSSNSKELSKDLSYLINRKVKTIYSPCFQKLQKLKKLKKNRNINILNVARLEKQKDHATLLKAINYSKYKNKINLTIIGYGSKKKQIENYSKKYKLNLKIFENQTKLNKFYKNTHLFILTSIYEGLPTVMIEAASYRIPIISSNFKSGSREVLCNGKGGYLFNIKNYKHLAKLINLFYEKPRLFYQKERCCSKNLKRFSFKQNICLFNKVLEKLI